MNTELERKIVDKFPEMMVNYRGSSSKTAFSYGFECGDGWFDLINTLCITINSYINSRLGRIEPVIVSQIKEKFGGLRFYYTGGDEYIMGAVALAEEISYHICEVCGDRGKLYTKGWCKTLCQTHADESGRSEEQTV